MIEKQPGVLYTTDNAEVERIIAMMRNTGIPVPDFDKSKTTLMPFVYYDKCFKLYLLMYCANDTEDSGYLAYHITNFMTENKFNFKPLENMGLDVDELVNAVLVQTKYVAAKVDFHFPIGLWITDDFIGLEVFPEHPAEMITNKKGSAN